MSHYIGITIGPINETMSLTSSPAGLWASSYLFSYLAHEIRKNIGKPGLIQDDMEDVATLFEKGVGLYHDRVIYKADEKYDLDNANRAVKNAVDLIVAGFAKSEIFNGKENELKDFFYTFFNIHILCVELKSGENFLIAINDALDAAELEKKFSSGISFNPILTLFDGDDKHRKGRNNEIKESFLVSKGDKGRNNWVLSDKSERGILDLPTIAAVAKDNDNSLDRPKVSVYYAVIRADGDNMGKTIKDTITDEDKYIEFSKKCLRYGCKTAKTVLEYGGVPIYVGGDDLLCIVPLMCKLDDGDHSFLDMIKKIRNGFKEEFPGEPDLSFGVQIQYVKSPLYEALDESGRLLFGFAKSNKPGALAINLKKHSGQSAEILIKELGGSGEQIRTDVDSLIHKHAKEDTLKSVGKHVADFSELYNQAISDNEAKLDNFFDNVFDNGVTDVGAEYINRIKELAKLIKGNADDLVSYIRFIKFFSEKADREEEV